MNENERLPIDSDLLQTFVRIAECGNLTVAAGKLGRTQSAISVQLRKLEEGLGTTLFLRTAKGMVLTPAGEALLSRAKLIVAEIRETAQLFREPLTGSIHVGLPDDFDETVLECILMGFSRTHPGVQVLARSGCTSGYAAAIRTGELDVAVCSGLDDPGGEPLDTEEIVWAAREGLIWSEAETVPLAVLDRPCYWRDLPKQLLDAQGRKHRIAFQSGSFTSLQAALRAGVAIGLLPKSCVCDGLQILAESDGLPSLPTSHRSIMISANASEQIATAMVEAIRKANQR
ncbi:LysR family transcriptional regulator [Roseovarius sp. EL26]|uniref:LysR family transcriptional regulator n=1 Tax=Roseovarius sp. EL26 TaxID=2126672 RepID=UPI000EA02052|nr:LysR family transcriptional regulator [Roseovarius sp. EL26]